jgi:hypothetical protein
MKFDTPATTNPIDQLKVVGQPLDRIDGRLKTTGQAPYAYEHNDAVRNHAYGYVVGAAIAKGRITAMDLSRGQAAPGCWPSSPPRMPVRSTRAVQHGQAAGRPGGRPLPPGHRAWWWPRPSSRHAKPPRWCGGLRPGRGALRPRRAAGSAPLVSGDSGEGSGHRTRPRGDFEAPSRRARASLTPPTPRRTRAMR